LTAHVLEADAEALLGELEDGWLRNQVIGLRTYAVTSQFAAHALRFLKAPTSRSYVMNYRAGRNLCRAYVAGEPERFRRLLTEQVRVGDLLAA
jgi:hypothetical protein